MNPKPTPASTRTREIFLQALEQPVLEDRAAYLEKACGTDLVLRVAVERLLENNQEDSFLETPVMQSRTSSAATKGPGGTIALWAEAEKPGDRIGRYKLLQEIGEGGCGTVYMAEQEEPVRRRIALKIVKLGMDTKSVIARFEAERQALALMDHPNIAKVLDAGATGSGRPYFVMELVRGVKITEYCDQNNLPTAERLRLFIKVCQAIQHAHQKGIIHRDIKPSNILVTLHDGVPVPKVIDFGIAKATTDQRLTDKTMFTAFQQFIGTPAYMSPEQAEMSGLDIDTRTDIYGLGVLLYEMLTGKTPFDATALMASGLDAMRRTIREQEPVRPSTRLRTMIDAEITTTAKHQQAEPAQLATLMRGDLDWIVMKALEKDRTRRYETANSLAMDVQRHLNNEPVMARPPSRIYQFQKFVRRNKVIVTAGATMLVVLIVAAVVSSWQAIRATKAKREQSRLRETAEQAQRNEGQQRQRAEKQELAALRQVYNSDMNLVPQALAANNYGRAVDLLNRHRPKSGAPDFRQWEWRYFWDQVRSEAAFALPPQSNAIAAIALSPDGRFLVSGSMGKVILWDLFRRAALATVRESGPGPAAFTFSPSGDRLALAVHQGPRRSVVKIWAIATRAVIGEFSYNSGVQSLAFNPDGTKLITLGQDMALRTWDFEKQTLSAPIEGGGEGPGGERPPRRKVAVFSPDGKWLAVANDGQIRLLDVETGVERRTMAAFEEGLASLAFSPNGELLAASPLFTETDTSIKLFATATGKEIGQLAGHVSWVPGLIFTADGSKLISAGSDQTVRVWDVKERRELAALRGHRSEVNCVAVSPDGKTVLSGCKDGTLFGWDLERTQLRKAFHIIPQRVASIEFLPDLNSILTVNTDGTVSLWDSAGAHEKERISSLGNTVERIVVSPDGARLYAGSRDGRITVLDWPTRLIVTNLPGFASRGFAGGPVGLIDNGRTLVAASADSTIRLWDTASWVPRGGWKTNARRLSFSQLAISPDQRFLLFAGFPVGVELLNLQNGQIEDTLTGQNWGPSGMAFSPDAKLLAIASREGTVTLRDVSTRVTLDVLRGHLLGVHAVAFSPDGQRLASSSSGQEAVKLSDVTTRYEVVTLAGEGSIFPRVSFSPDGKFLVAINAQGKAHLWQAPSLKEIEKIEASNQ